MELDANILLNCLNDEELKQFAIINEKIREERDKRLNQNPKEAIEEPEYFYAETHPEFINHSGIGHLFVSVKTELHHMDESCENLLDIDQIADIKYHVVVKPGIDPINLTKDFLDHLDKSIDTSYVNIEKEKNKQETT